MKNSKQQGEARPPLRLAGRDPADDADPSTWPADRRDRANAVVTEAAVVMFLRSGDAARLLALRAGRGGADRDAGEVADAVAWLRHLEPRMVAAALEARG